MNRLQVSSICKFPFNTQYVVWTSKGVMITNYNELLHYLHRKLLKIKPGDETTPLNDHVGCSVTKKSYKQRRIVDFIFNLPLKNEGDVLTLKQIGKMRQDLFLDATYGDPSLVSHFPVQSGCMNGFDSYSYFYENSEIAKTKCILRNTSLDHVIPDVLQCLILEFIF
jgi:hypothetical protein